MTSDGNPADRSHADPLTLRPGERVGPYELVALIGAGGMGEVYEAHDDRLGRRVAIKVLPAWSATDPHRLWRFEQEARAAAVLKHPNVVAVFDVGHHGETRFIVSELLEGENLRQRMAGGSFFALGAMLYEMLVGAQPFRGRSAIDTLSAILSSEPAPLANASPGVPADLARIVHRCLEKSPDARFQSAADLAFALESATASSAATNTTGSVSVGASPAVAAGASAARSGDGTHGLGRSWAWRVLVGAGLPLLGGLVAIGLLRFGAPSAPALPLLRLSLAPPPGVTWGAVPAVSPDGRRVAFVGVWGAQTQLFIQSLESREASAIPGTSGAMHPFWSSDSTRVGFLASPAGVGASLELRTVGLDGTVGSPQWTGLSRGAAFAPVNWRSLLK